MSESWTSDELHTASEAMKRAGHMGYEEFCAELDRQIKPEPTPTLNTEHWDCECEEKYIHCKSVDRCDECDALRGESPDSRQSEVDEGIHFAY